jgi:hypothetical protein
MVASLATVAFAAPAAASDADLAIATGTRIVSGVPAGGEVGLTEVAAGPLEGRTCDVLAARRGDGPVHGGNDLLVRSGTGELVLADVEREPGATTQGADPIELGPVVAISLRMGPDEQFTGDLLVELSCRPAVSSFGAPGATDGPHESRLPLTGGDIVVLAAIATGLLGVGALTMAGVRRRRNPTPVNG